MGTGSIVYSAVFVGEIPFVTEYFQMLTSVHLSLAHNYDLPKVIMLKRFTVFLFIIAICGIANGEARSRTSRELDSIPVTVCVKGKCDPKVALSAIPMNASVGAQFSDFFSSLFDTSRWPDRWNCGIWTPVHGWVYILSDFSIWLSYFAIPIILGYFVYKKRVENIPFKTVLILFITFILACGLTHLMDAAIFWWPAYKLSAVLRLGTAIISMATVLSLIKVIPGVLELKSPAMLEQQVKERTKDLQFVNEQLQSEMLERKRTSDHLRASNEELMAFSYSVSHDLRAPLRSINGFSQALLEDYENHIDKTGLDFLVRIRNASVRMGELIDDMLKLSKISRDQVELETINLSEIVNDVIEAYRQRVPEITTVFQVEENIQLMGDYKLLKIAIENLVDNAIKYSSKKEAPVVQFGKVEGEQGLYFIKDNGAGFDMLFADKLFGAFQRLHDGEFDGSGIGLATVKRIILMHGGRIWAEAKVNEGAVFYFTL